MRPKWLLDSHPSRMVGDRKRRAEARASMGGAVALMAILAVGCSQPFLREVY